LEGYAVETGNGKTTEMRGRLAEKPDRVILEHIYQKRLKRDEAILPYLTEANLAHVIMLARTGIIQESDAKALLKVLMHIDKQGKDLFDLDAELEGLYYNYERYLIETLGSRTGGRLHTGRSRNDLGATTSRMKVRDLVLRLLHQIIEFRSSLLRMAQEHLDTVITGYTHLQPAQPITLAHYLTAIEQALQRDTARMLRAFENTNRSCLGAGALAGTGFPIDRQLTADLLGFDGFLENTLDAVGGRDYLLELFSGLAILAITLSRLAQDLFVWYTHEFGIIGLPDRLGGTSSIMPQKKNPIIMETSKGRLSHVLGGLISALSAMKNTNYTNVIDVNSESFYLLEDSAGQIGAVLELLQAAIENMEVRKDRAYEMASANFSTVTELADTLVREKDYPFREAHHIVGVIVRKALQKGLVATQITSEFIDRVIIDEIGTPIGLPEDKVRQALDPKENVSVRAHEGGPAPSAVATTIERARKIVERDAHFVETTEHRLQEAKATLRRTAQDMIDRLSIVRKGGQTCKLHQDFGQL
jgi:argininosuccinate lyase